MAEKDIRAFVGTMDMFRGLDKDALGRMAAVASCRKTKKGEIFFCENDPGNGFYVMMSGRVKVFKLSAEGKEQILHIFGPKEPFGEVPVFSGKNFPANAQALEAGWVLFFPRERFVDLIRKHPEMALNLLAVLSLRLRNFTATIENLTLKEVPGRLAAYLMSLNREQQGKGRVELKISKGLLANVLGTIPETLSRIFAKLSDMGLIRVNGPVIHLLDEEGLADLADAGRARDG